MGLEPTTLGLGMLVSPAALSGANATACLTVCPRLRPRLPSSAPLLLEHPGYPCLCRCVLELVLVRSRFLVVGHEYVNSVTDPVF